MIELSRGSILHRFLQGTVSALDLSIQWTAAKGIGLVAIPRSMVHFLVSFRPRVRP